MNVIELIQGVNPMVYYFVGLVASAIMAILFAISIRYYIKAKNLVPFLHKIKELNERIDELESKVTEKNQDLKDKLEEITRAERLIQQGKDAEQWLKDKKSEIDDLQQNIVRARQELEKEKGAKEELDEKISARQQELAKIEQKSVEAEEKVRNAVSEVEAIRRENAELSVMVPRMRKELELILAELEQKKKLLEQCEKDLAETNAKLGKAKAEYDRVTSAIAEKKHELERLSKEIKEAEGTVIGLESRAKVAKEFIAEQEARREAGDEIWKNLDTAVASDYPRRRFAATEETRWLEHFKGNLEDCGFIFDERAIKAFHTGLKCAQQTPLVVLSGISGTGKSLLPELYAAAIGANFLGVPVQPRWDSPQDLFGFYNYMEARYKATELARLLWQFDRYNNDVAKKNYSSLDKLPLNIVLLDEMNLARVEYYFSDLLSKLETRNGLNPENADERHKAEIELECNSSGGKRAMRRLFVSKHMLFIGTMNEDESTQMLSDKVIDRSNVLRFGRPESLTLSDESRKAMPDKSAFVQRFAESGRVSAFQWDRWCVGIAGRSDKANAISFLEETLRPVIKALDSINRPYGYRVDQAMRLYTMNYPGSYKDAVADQIEMKILPKLNGVELDNPHFEEVKAAIETAIAMTGDGNRSLAEAFASACNAETYFKWRGVMR